MLRNLIVASLFVIVFVRPVSGAPIPFAIGMSSSITVPTNDRVVLPAVLVNTGAEPLVFDDLEFGWSWAAGSMDPGGLNPLNIEFPGSVFTGVTISAGGLFTFPFSSISFDPSLATELHPLVSFQISLDAIGSVRPAMRATIPLAIRVGPQTEFGPLVFVDASQVGGAPIPEPSTLVLLLAGGALAGLRSRVRNR